MAARTICPGCGLELPGDATPYAGYYHASAECWGVYTEVLASEYGNAVLFGRVHQLTVDTYAAQHAGGSQPKKSVAVHLAGLHLALEREQAAPDIPHLLQRVAARVETWPHFEPPAVRAAMTVLDVALSGSPRAHADSARAWARSVWATWSDQHDAVRAFVSEHL